MNLKFLIRFVPIALLIVVLYLIWPAPFAYLGRRVILPAAQAVGNVAKSTVSPIRFLWQLKSLSQKNKELEGQNNSLKAEIAKVKQENAICAELKNELSTTQLGEIQTTVAMVVGSTPQLYGQKVIVNKGSEDQIKLGAAVLSHGYLVGKVDKVFSNRTEIYLISNRNSLVPVVTDKSRDTGLIQGGLEGLSMIDLPANSKVAVGEKVVTSGLGGDFSSGILVGEIEGLIGEKNSLFLTAKVSTPVNFAGLDVVSITL